MGSFETLVAPLTNGYFGVLVTEAVHPDADVGVIYFAQQVYWAMCGSGTFALGVFLIECGLIDVKGIRY
jgi:proline racemase/trans-L-3-hydroxyproline dehydratase